MAEAATGDTNVSIDDWRLVRQRDGRFTARFGGVSQPVDVPVGAVLAVYARETGQGMVLPEEAGAPARSAPSAEPGPAADQAPAGGVSPLAAVPDANDSPDSPPDGPADPTPGKRPHLRVVK